MDESPHTLPLVGGWAVWRDVVLRSTGFPISDVLRLADEQLGTLATAAELARERADAAKRDTFRQIVSRTHDGTLTNNAARKILRALLAGAVPSLTESAIPHQELADLARPHAERARADAAFRAAYAAAADRAWHELETVARRDEFRRALIWQNPQANAQILRRLGRAEPGHLAQRDRAARMLLARYVQRYATKNETIGFFGPLCWATLDPDVEHMRVTPGVGLVARASTLFEYWAIDRAATRWGREPELWMSLRPRLAADVRIEGALALQHGGPPRALSPLELAVVQAARGQLSVRALVAEVSTALSVARPDVIAAVESLRDKAVIVVRLDVDVTAAAPEHVLRDELASLAKTPAREQALAKLDALEAARDAAAAATTADELETALARFGELFREHVGAPYRNAGKLYGARLPLYQEAARDLECVVGRGVLARVGPALELLLLAARWFTYELGARYRAQLAREFDGCSHDADGACALLAFYERVAQLFEVYGEPPAPFAQVNAQLQHRWRELLSTTADARRAAFASDELRERAARLFDAPGPGWRAARYHTPDLMIAARSVEAVARGDYQIVLGEHHPAMNTVYRRVFYHEHPSPQHLADATRIDLGAPGYVPTVQRQTANRLALFPFEQDVCVDFGGGGSSSAHVVRVADLVVRRRGDAIVIAPRSGGRECDALDFFHRSLAVLCAMNFRPFAPHAHLPRIAIDGVIMQRETWAFDRDALAFLSERDDAACFLAVRRFAQQHGLPRFCFFRVAEELKPCYLDLDSPVLVALFRWYARETRSITISEMLPAPDECWLPDAEDRRYCAELRLPMRDPQPWRAC